MLRAFSVKAPGAGRVNPLVPGLGCCWARAPGQLGDAHHGLPWALVEAAVLGFSGVLSPSAAGLQEPVRDELSRTPELGPGDDPAVTTGVFLRVLCALLENTGVAVFSGNLWTSCLCPGSFHRGDEWLVQRGSPLQLGSVPCSLEAG